LNLEAFLCARCVTIVTVKIYCSGIGGIGLSALAALYRADGHAVLGSDRTETDLTRRLREQGIAVTTDQGGSGFPDDTDLFLYSAAVPDDAPERLHARKLGIRELNYFQALGAYARGFGTVIAVCGTHGKSTTTAMAALVLLAAGLDPTVVVGTKVPQLDGRNWRKGGQRYLVLEACEYRRHFLEIEPSMVLLTNADGDHFDAFDSVEDYQGAFADFLRKLPADGPVITHMDDPDCRRIARESGRRSADAEDVSGIRLSIPGRHMLANAALVAVLGRELGIDARVTRETLHAFRGTWRRLEERGATPAGATVVDDYAHHPKEVACTLAAAREKYRGARRICVFQPHMHNRVAAFREAFASAFTDADAVWLLDVYEARREATQGIDARSMERFAGDIARGSATQCTYVGTPESARGKCLALGQGDVILCMGAGDVTDLATALVMDR